MNQPNQERDFSPERIGHLSGWAMVALAARNASRVLPAYVPKDVSPPRRATKLRAAGECCAVGIHAARGAGSGYVLIGGEAAEALQGSATDVNDDVARSCIAAAGSAGNAISVDGILQSALEGISAYQQVARSHGESPVFEEALEDDLRELERLNFRGAGAHGRQVPAEFFARPLYGRQPLYPDRWAPIVEEWSAALDRLEIGLLKDFYIRMCRGQLIEEGELTAVIDTLRASYTADLQRDEAVPPGAAPPPPLRREPVNGGALSATDPIRPDAWMLSDRPLEQNFAVLDRFNFQDYAVALAA